MLRSHDLHLLMSFFTIEIVADLTFPLPLLYLMISFSPRFFTSSICSFQGPLAALLPLVGSSGLEPPTSRLSGARSNQLSYEPMAFALSRLLAFTSSAMSPWWR